jgi:hypothetical protein
MFLTDEEKRMLSGEYGPGIQRAIDLLVKLGDSFGVERMVKASYAHDNYDMVPEDFWNLITEGAKPLLKVTTHPVFQPEKWKEWGLTQGPRADEFIAEHQRKLKKIRELGWLKTDTCAEYLLGIIPRQGEVVAMHGSCMQVANNSLYGAMVDRAGDFCTKASAICGRVPMMGLMLPENRHAKVLIQLEDLDVAEWTDSHYSCLGYYIGEQVAGMENIAINGLPPNIPFDFARSLVLPLPTSGAVTLAHIIGTTPEAPNLKAALGNKRPEQVITVRERELKETWEKLSVADSDVVEHVAFGCPHCTIDEIGRIAAMLEGKMLKASMLIGASVPVVALARAQGWADIIERAGGHFLPACVSVNNPFTRPDIAAERQAKSAATDSARAAHYLARVSGINTFFGTKEQCVNAGLTGKWEGGQSIWK